MHASAFAMSLFSMRDVWTHRVGAGEEYDRGCIIVGNVDGGNIEEEARRSVLEKGRVNKVVTGSLDGILRIFYPTHGNFDPADLLLEQQLDGPVLQLAIGRFSSASATMELAVLHPRTLSVFRVVSDADDAASETKQCRLELKYVQTCEQAFFHSFVHSRTTHVCMMS